MQGRDVIVLCNLKPRAMRGITSHGMLLCASNEDHSEVRACGVRRPAPPDERTKQASIHRLTQASNQPHPPTHPLIHHIIPRHTR